MWKWVHRYQNVSILDFIGAKDDGGGGDNWSCRACKDSVKSSKTNKPNTQIFTGWMCFLLPNQQHCSIEVRFRALKALPPKNSCMNSILNAVVDVTRRGLVNPYLDRNRQGRRATNFIGISYMEL